MKKSLALFIAFVLVVTMLSGVTAFAAEGDSPDVWRLTDNDQLGSGWLSNAFWEKVADPNGPKTIIIDYPLTLNNTNRVEITRELTIKVDAASGYGTINSNLPTNTKHFIVGAGGMLTLEGLTLRGSASPQTGGLSVKDGGKLYVKDCVIDSCNGGWDPHTAAIVVGDGGYLEMTGCTVKNSYNNMSLFDVAGAMYVCNNGSAFISDTLFEANRVSNSYQGYQCSHIAYQLNAELWFGDGVTFSNGGNSAIGYNSIANPEYGYYGVGVDGQTIDSSHPMHISNKFVPADPMNALGMSGNRAIELGAADFSFDALLQLDNVNLIEAEFSYDASEFYVEAVAVPEGLTVNKVDVWGADGKVTVVLGVQGKDGAFAPEELASLVSFTMRPIDGKPETATLTLTSAKLYAKGEIVEYELLDGSYTVTLNYRAPEDVNDDGVIDAADLSVALYYFGAVEADDDWDEAVFSDVNGDGEVDILDISLLIEAIYG